MVQDKNQNLQTNSISTTLDQSIFKGIINTKNNNLTQEFILKSPSVLKPVYKVALEKYSSRDQNIEKLSYQKWISNTLNIGFEEGTQVLNITFLDTDKELILEILNLIRDKYQDYSRSEKEKDLIKTISYLEVQQKIIKEKTLNSLKALNEFSIENGLGDFQGFVALEDQNFNQENFYSNQEIYFKIKNKDSNRNSLY